MKVTWEEMIQAQLNPSISGLTLYQMTQIILAKEVKKLLKQFYGK